LQIISEKAKMPNLTNILTFTIFDILFFLFLALSKMRKDSERGGEALREFPTPNHSLGIASCGTWLLLFILSAPPLYQQGVNFYSFNCIVFIFGVKIAF
jgi:hypothetical protein